MGAKGFKAIYTEIKVSNLTFTPFLISHIVYNFIKRKKSIKHNGFLKPPAPKKYVFFVGILSELLTAYLPRKPITNNNMTNNKNICKCCASKLKQFGSG